MWKRLIFAVVLISGPVCAADRDAAEWVLRQGGRITLNGGRQEIAHIADLPKGDFAVTGVDLIGTIINPKDLVKISGLAGLKQLFLPGASWTPGAGSKLDENASLKYLAGLKNLELLQFSLHFLPYFNVTDKGLAEIASLTQLKELRCAQCRVQKDGLAPFVNLESLDLSYSEFGDAGMPSLRSASV